MSRCTGFRFGAAACGIKSSGDLDLGIIASERPAAAAAVFTRNRLAAAPVIVSRRALRESGGELGAVVVNSGNANACTGTGGERDAATMQSRTAARLDLVASRVAVASTGVIGEPLPMNAVTTGIENAAAALDPDGWDQFSRAILTTDRGPKVARRTARIDGGEATLLGCTKGAGMIAPDMATTLTFVVSDAEIGAGALGDAVRAGCAETFNAITVDGDTSTNDMILVMANGASGARASGPAEQQRLGRALNDLLAELATSLMRDGEGVHHVVTVRVTGAADEASARRVARAIAISPLVKTAIAGRDPNWGRILCAAGNAGVELAPDRLALRVGDVEIVRGGVAVPEWPEREARAAEVMSRPEYTVELDLGGGAARGHYLACDLSHDYVTINADYRT